MALEDSDQGNLNGSIYLRDAKITTMEHSLFFLHSAFYCNSAEERKGHKSELFCSMSSNELHTPIGSSTASWTH
jgi:hypothetical protein